MRTQNRFIHLLLPLLILLSACGTKTPVSTATILPASPISPPSSIETINPVTTPTVITTHVSPARTQYTLNVELDYTNKSLSVEQFIAYPNQTGETLSDVLLAVVPNMWPGVFTLFVLNQDDAPLSNYTLEGQRLLVSLLNPLPPGATLKLGLSYVLYLPQIDIKSDPNLIRPQIFGYTDRQINLVDWHPFVVPYVPGQGWLLHDPWFYGEHLVYDMADFEVNIRFANPTVTPVIAASGPAEPNGEWTRYTLKQGRTFAISASTEFQMSSMIIGDLTINSYYFPSDQEAGESVLQASEQAIQIFSKLYGPYPHTTLSAVKGDFNDGMEYSAFYFLPRDFYNLYDGTPKNYLTFVSVHEMAHQWWFEQVANDQALEPWLDEALCTYSELVFYEAEYPDLVDWWWEYRIDSYHPEGWVDIPIYDGGGFRPYTNAVYFRGAYFLEELRARIGDEAFFAFLKDYLFQEAGKRATTQDFFTILGQHTDAAYSDIVRAYFQNPQ